MDSKKTFHPGPSKPMLQLTHFEYVAAWILSHITVTLSVRRLLTKKRERSLSEGQSQTDIPCWRSSSSLCLPTADSVRYHPEGYLLGLASKTTRTHFEELQRSWSEI